MNTPAADALINYGLVRVNDAEPGDTATLIVVGLPRSGTSMVAAVLKSLGVFIGKTIDNVVFEDIDIAAALDESKPQRLAALFDARNAEHRIWGFKRPEAYKQLPRICAACRNPRVIVTFRDILAISLRNNISMQMDPVKFLPNLAAEYQALVSTIARLSAPCLLISYEKAIQFPRKTAAEIAAFSGVAATDDEIGKAAAVVENGNPKYVQAARLQYQGSVERLIDGQLRGWVKVRTLDKVRVNVELQLDGHTVQRARADHHRPDIEQAGFGDGRYGFEFAIGSGISRDSIINVRIENSTISIENSGLPLSQY